MTAGDVGTVKSGLVRFFLALLGIVAFVTFAVQLEQHAGVPFAVTYRIACAVACLYIMNKMRADYEGQQWPTIAIAIALLFDIALFFSPLKHLPASKGDILFFAAPDASILLLARIVTYPVTDDHQRAVRQQLIVGLILALAICSIILAMLFIPPVAMHPRG